MADQEHDDRKRAIMNLTDLAIVRLRNTSEHLAQSGGSRFVWASKNRQYILGLMDQANTQLQNAESDDNRDAQVDWLGCFLRLRDLRRSIEL